MFSVGDPDPDPLVRGTDPRIQIRTKMSRIPNTEVFKGPFLSALFYLGRVDRMVDPSEPHVIAVINLQCTGVSSKVQRALLQQYQYSGSGSVGSVSFWAS